MQCGDWEEYNYSVQPQKSPETRPADVTDRMTSEEEQLKLGQSSDVLPISVSWNVRS